MILFLQCVVACGLFSAVILPLVFKNPINHLLSYPKAIRTRVESLPEYKGTLKKAETKDIFRKLIGVIISIILIGVIAFFSDAKTFTSAFWHCFILFQSINLFDVIVLDIIIFRNSKKVIIKGTEDMVDDYKNILHTSLVGFTD